MADIVSELFTNGLRISLSRPYIARSRGWSQGDMEIPMRTKFEIRRLRPDVVYGMREEIFPRHEALIPPALLHMQLAVQILFYHDRQLTSKRT
jgi:hypothetical protein